MALDSLLFFVLPDFPPDLFSAGLSSAASGAESTATVGSSVAILSEREGDFGESGLGLGFGGNWDIEDKMKEERFGSDLEVELYW